MDGWRAQDAERSSTKPAAEAEEESLASNSSYSGAKIGRDAFQSKEGIFKVSRIKTKGGTYCTAS
jgi:hypothetical protein